jgi:hypothetical protein
MTSATGTGKYEQVLERCKSLEAIPTAVAHPCEKSALAGAIEAGQLGLIRPILVGLLRRRSKKWPRQPASISETRK